MTWHPTKGRAHWAAWSSSWKDLNPRFYDFDSWQLGHMTVRLCSCPYMAILPRCACLGHSTTVPWSGLALPINGYVRELTLALSIHIWTCQRINPCFAHIWICQRIDPCFAHIWTFQIIDSMCAITWCISWSHLYKILSCFALIGHVVTTLYHMLVCS